jgi:hypothetical protein
VGQRGEVRPRILELSTACKAFLIGRNKSCCAATAAAATCSTALEVMQIDKRFHLLSKRSLSLVVVAIL